MRDSRGQVDLLNEKKKRARRKGALLVVLGAAMMAVSIVFGGQPFLL